VFGGFAGENFGEIFYSYATGNLEKLAGYDVSYTAGGFVGANDGYINNAYATGNVSSEYTAGGFVSSNTGTIENAFATGKVTGRVEMGGFVSSNRLQIENAFFAGSMEAMEGTLNGGGCYASGNAGLIGGAIYNKDGCIFDVDSVVEGAAFADMKMSSLYKDWTDFDKYWVLDDTMSFPNLVFTTGVFSEIPEVEPPVKVVESALLVANGVDNGLKLYGNQENLRASVTLSRSGLTNVKVYNLKGRLLKTITLGMMGEGVHQVDLSGAAETRGMSLFMLEQDGRMLSRSVLR
jgi:hypothetical protein